MSEALEIHNLNAGYESATVVRSFDLSVETGEVVAVLGPNGAGKTTLVLTIAGLLPRLGGTITLDGRALRSGRPVEANRAGVILVPDDRALFPTLTVQENVEAARRKGSPNGGAILDIFPALGERWKLAAAALSGGEQQMLALARALVQNPRVLLIDEMSMGLAPVIVEGLLPTVRKIADSTGAVVVLVEQHVQLALELADRAVVLVHGEVSLSGLASELSADPGRLEAAYMGSIPPDASHAG